MIFEDENYDDILVPGTDAYESGAIWRHVSEWYDDMEDDYGEDDDEFRQEEY